MAKEYTLGGPPPQSRSEKILMKQNSGHAQSRIEELLKNASGRTSGALIYKGTVETAMSLPSSGNEAGDMYHVNSDGSEWAWNGEQWEELGKSSSILYTEQSLTPAQQEQARGNIGAGTYTKPSGGIPASDLASAVQTSLGKADTALQTAPVTSVNTKTGAVTLSASDVGALPSSTTIPTKTSDLTNDSNFQTAAQVSTAIAAAAELPSGGTAGDFLCKTASGVAWETVPTYTGGSY